MSTTPQQTTTKIPTLSRGDQRLAECMSLPDVEALVTDLASLHGEITGFDSALAHRLDEMNAEQQSVRARYQPALDTLEAQRAPLLHQRDAKLLMLEAWAAAHKASLFNGDRRCLRLLSGVIGFRLRPPSVEIVEGKKVPVIAATIAAWAWAKGFVKRGWVLDKNALLAARQQLDADPTKRGLLADAGIRIVQPDEFYFEPRTENPDTAKAAA